MSDEHSFGFENVEIEGTFKTPYIKLDKDEGIIELKGNSIPENTKEFYWPVNRWLTEYSSQPAKETTVNIALTYANSSSAVVITRILQLIDGMIGMNTFVTIHWYYESDDNEMREMGEYYQGIMKSPIKLHKIEAED